MCYASYYTIREMAQEQQIVWRKNKLRRTKKMYFLCLSFWFFFWWKIVRNFFGANVSFCAHNFFLITIKILAWSLMLQCIDLDFFCILRAHSYFMLKSKESSRKKKVSKVDLETASFAAVLDAEAFFLFIYVQMGS